MNLRDLFGNGHDRPPAPEVASADDVEQYNMKWLRNNPVEDTGGSTTADDATMDLPFAKQALSDERRLEQKSEFPWLYDPSRGVRWDFDPVQLRNLGQENTWVGMLVQSITKEVAETPWTILKTKDRAETRKRLQTHPEKREPIAKADGEEFPDRTSERIHDLLLNPNPDEGWHDAVEMWMADLLEVGSATVVKYFPKSRYTDGEHGRKLTTTESRELEPRALQTSAPEVWTKDYFETTGLLEGYWQFEHEKAPGGGSAEGGTSGSWGYRTPIRYDKAEVMWTDMTPRSNRRYGMPPTLLVEDFLQSLDLAVNQEQQYLSRGSIPSGAWVFEEYDRKELMEMKEEQMANVKGKPHKSLVFAGRGGDVRYEAMSMNFQELEFTERMQWYARVVASVFQVPTAVVGIEPENINYHTFQGERENFEENTLGPYLQKLERFINSELITPHWGSGYHFEFKPGVSETTRQAISDRVRSEFNSNLITRNEARQELGRDEAAEEGFKDEVVEETDPTNSDGGPLEDIGLSLEKANGGAVEFPNAGGPALDRPTTLINFCDDLAEVSDGGVFVGENQYPDELTGDGDGQPVRAVGINDRKAFAVWSRYRDKAVALSNPETIDRADVEKLAGGDSGNANSAAVSKDEPLRETDEWYQFDVQPHMVESLQSDIADDIQALFDEVLSDADVQAAIERLATPDDGDTTDGSAATEKSLNALSRRLKELLQQTQIAGDVAEAIRERSADAVRETLEETISEADPDDPASSVDIDAVTSRLRDRDVGFANRFADELADDIRETVGDGYAEGKNSFEIREDIAEQADISEGWNGAERIARQELQIATGEARSAVAADLDKVEVWNTAGDDRVREAHAAMDGRWKTPGEAFEVDYSGEGRGVKKESVPGDSEPGIGCRCTTLLRDREDVDAGDYAGDAGIA